jgi:hypothetical protein
MPFANQLERDLHFTKHGHKFGAVDALEYERMAETFLFGQLGDDARDCFRTNGQDRVRFGFVTRLEGVAQAPPAIEYIRTFFPVRMTMIARRGGEAGYFAYECARVPGINL